LNDFIYVTIEANYDRKYLVDEKPYLGTFVDDEGQIILGNDVRFGDESLIRFGIKFDAKLK